jgi:hypothetical protein
MDAGSTNLNRCLHRAQNLVCVPRLIAVRRLANTISRNKACHSAHKDSTVTAVLLYMRRMQARWTTYKAQAVTRAISFDRRRHLSPCFICKVSMDAVSRH